MCYNFVLVFGCVGSDVEGDIARVRPICEKLHVIVAP